MEAFQGLEKNVVVLCTTRSRVEWVEKDRRSGLGIVGDSKMFNVALTRAKHGLIVVGNPDVLQLDASWREFLAFCYRNDLVEFEDEEMGPDNGLVANKRDINAWRPTTNDENDKPLPRLERVLLQRAQDQETGFSYNAFYNGAEEDPMWGSHLANAEEEVLPVDGVDYGVEDGEHEEAEAGEDCT
jgi:hypothetical protein